MPIFKKKWFSRGSVLILVLWVLTLIGFLCAEYLSHNRDQAVMAARLWDVVQTQEAVDSVLALFGTDVAPILAAPAVASTLSDNSKNSSPAVIRQPWMHMSVGNLKVCVLADKEADRINLNTASEGDIRQRIRDGLGAKQLAQADALTDTILDWRDADNLARVNGAEAADYRKMRLSYVPANGFFKVLPELLLVKNVTPKLFWGPDVSASASDDVDSGQKQKEFSLLDAFTIYPKDVKRIRILIPNESGGAVFVVAFLQKTNNKWQVLDLYRTYLLTQPADSLVSESGQ